MGIIFIGGIVAGVAFAANNQEESPVLWGLLAFLLCLVGGMAGGLIGQFAGGGAAFVGLQMKISRFG
ncbi:MAG: hypothetical protein ACR2OA_20595 [Rubripirellula sp.]